MKKWLNKTNIALALVALVILIFVGHSLHLFSTLQSGDFAFVVSNFPSYVTSTSPTYTTTLGITNYYGSAVNFHTAITCQQAPIVTGTVSPSTYTINSGGTQSVTMALTATQSINTGTGTDCCRLDLYANIPNCPTGTKDASGYCDEVSQGFGCTFTLTGCQYNNPACDSSHNCVSNVCVLKSGCQYNNPACISPQTCQNNVCVSPSGCQYNNPVCDINHDCVSNTCVLKSGCAYSNPACGSGYTCTNNACVSSVSPPPPTLTPDFWTSTKTYIDSIIAGIACIIKQLLGQTC